MGKTIRNKARRGWDDDDWDYNEDDGKQKKLASRQKQRKMKINAREAEFLSTDPDAPFDDAEF